MEHPFFVDDAAETGVRAGTDRSMRSPVLTVGQWNVMQISRVKAFAVIEQEMAKLGLAKAHGVREHCLEDRSHVTRRGADDFEHIGGRGLLLTRLLQFEGERSNLPLQVSRRYAVGRCFPSPTP